MERQLRSWKVFLIRDAYFLFEIVVYVFATVFVLVNLCFGCSACGDCDAFLISQRQIASISDAITALSRSHHQQWGRDDSRRKESIKLRSRRWGLEEPFALSEGGKKVEKLSPHMAWASSVDGTILEIESHLLIDWVEGDAGLWLAKDNEDYKVRK